MPIPEEFLWWRLGVNFMGMGLSEMAVIFLVAFLVLGPSRSIDAARTVGRLMAELRRNFSEVTDAISVERDLQKGPRDSVSTEGVSNRDESAPPERRE